MVQGRGGVLGPDLSHVGEARSVPYLIDSIREPSKELTSGTLESQQPLRPSAGVRHRHGADDRWPQIVGVAKNEDTFSLQLLDTNQQLQFF